MKIGRLRTLFPSYICVLALLLVVAYLGNLTISAYNDNKSLLYDKCVIIDAGHGGIDGGATSVTGKLESELNLQIAIRLNDLLHLLGIPTIMVRSTDNSVHTEGDTVAQIKISDLKNRVKLANNSSGAILVSIHQNYFGQSKYRGAQVFSSKTEGSYELAQIMQKLLISTLDPTSNRKVMNAEGVYLMDKIKCTGILIECGFISNPTEAKKLESVEYQNKICGVIASVLSQYIKEDPIA